jgi:hypothetical protein
MLILAKSFVNIQVLKMKTLSVIILPIIVLSLLTGCKEKSDETPDSDSSWVGSADTIAAVGSARVAHDVRGFHDDSIPYEQYVEKYPNLQRRIEFEDLITLLAAGKKPGNDPNKIAGDWKVLADKNTSPVNWLSKGANGRRSGEVIINFENKPLETLDNYVIPVIWQITLMGPIEGPDKVTIECDELMSNVGMLDVPRLLAKKKIESELISSSGDPSTGEKQYKLNIPNKELLWMVYNWSCGSGGCSASFAIYYNLSAYTHGKSGSGSK